MNGTKTDTYVIETSEKSCVIDQFVEDCKDCNFCKKENEQIKKLLVVVDMQNDFIDGSLGSKEAVNIVPSVIEKIKNWDGDIVATKDSHDNNYLQTREGRYLPVKHCINGTDGHKIKKEIQDELFNKDVYKQVVFMNKRTFGSQMLAEFVRENGYNYVELIGLCTDICVVSNAILLKNYFPEIDIVVDAKCCAGVTPESHNAALLTMKMCQINILGE